MKSRARVNYPALMRPRTPAPSRTRRPGVKTVATFELLNDKVIAACNAVYALEMWLRPGLLGFNCGAHVESMRPLATRLVDERARMLDEAALKHPAVYPEGHPDAGKPHPQAGQHVKRIDTTTGVALEITVFKSREAGEEFNARIAELMNARSTFEVPQRLTMDDIRKIDAERLPNRRDGNDSAVDFGALLALIELPAPAAPAPVAATP